MKSARMLKDVGVKINGLIAAADRDTRRRAVRVIQMMVCEASGICLTCLKTEKPVVKGVVECMNCASERNKRRTASR